MITVPIHLVASVDAKPTWVVAVDHEARCMSKQPTHTLPMSGCGHVVQDVFERKQCDLVDLFIVFLKLGAKLCVSTG